jgi:hypothetical protein
MGSQRPSAMAHASAGSNNAPRKLNPLSSLLVILLLAHLKEDEEEEDEEELELDVNE